MAVDISIVIPTHNPQERIFARVLKGVESLDLVGHLNVECVIVDNRSDPPLSRVKYIQDFLAAFPGACVVQEDAQGLTYARLAGIRATSGDVVVVFDDDNVPGSAYLSVVTRCLREFPWVGVWGPGTVAVELLDPVPMWLQQRARETHGQRHERFVQYGCIPASWQPFYPIGMGQVIRRDVAETYRRAVENGTLNATDRKGGSLTSGGDIQIVWQAINMGLAAGLNPGLALTHLIPGSRTTVEYMKRLAFGCGMSYHPAIVQSFPGDDADRRNVPTTWQHVTDIVRFVARRVIRGRIRFLSMDFANLLGLMCGRLTVGGQGTDHWMFRLAKRLGLT